MYTCIMTSNFKPIGFLGLGELLNDADHYDCLIYFYFHLSYTCKFSETCHVGHLTLTLMFRYFWPRNILSLC